MMNTFARDVPADEHALQAIPGGDDACGHARPRRTTRMMLFYKGYGLEDTSGCTVRDHTERADWYVEDLRNGRSDAELVQHFERDLAPLLVSLMRAFGGANFAEADVEKLWGDEYAVNHLRWVISVCGLLHLGKITSDDRHGWKEEDLDTCAHCGIMGSFKRCPCSKHVWYCGPVYQKTALGRAQGRARGKAGEEARTARTRLG